MVSTEIHNFTNCRNTYTIYPAVFKIVTNVVYLPLIEAIRLELQTQIEDQKKPFLTECQINTQTAGALRQHCINSIMKMVGISCLRENQDLNNVQIRFNNIIPKIASAKRMSCLPLKRLKAEQNKYLLYKPFFSEECIGARTTQIHR